MRVVRPRAEEVGDLDPGREPGALVDLQHQRPLEDRPAGGLRHLARAPVAPAEDLELHGLRLGDGGRVGAHGQQPRRQLVLTAREAGTDPVARRVGLLPHHRRHHLAGVGRLQPHVPAAREGRGLVLHQLEPPPRAAVPVLPGQLRLQHRRPLARGAGHGRAVLASQRREREVDLHLGEGQGRAQAEQQRAPRGRARAEGVEAGLGLVIDGADVAEAGLLEHLHRVERGAERDQRTVGLEHDLDAVLVGAVGRHLRPLRHDHVRLGEIVHRREQDLPRGRTRRCQLEAHQLEELQVIELRHLAQAIGEQLGHPGEYLDHRHAGIRFIEIGPLRRVARNAGAHLRHDVGEAAVVDDREEITQRHVSPPR